MSATTPPSRSDDDLLKEMNDRADGTRVQPPQAPERKLKEREKRAFDKIQKVELGRWARIKAFFGKGKPDEEFDQLLEKTVDQQAKKRVEEFKASLTGLKDKSYKRIGAIGARAENQFLFLKMKAQVCRETIGHLKNYINDQKDFLTELKGLKSNLKSLDKAFAKENKKVDRLQAIETKARADLEQTDAGKRSVEIANADHDIRRMLIEHDPSCAATLDAALLDNARGKTAKINAIIAKIAKQKGKKPITAVLQELAGKIRGKEGFFSGATADTALIARHFAEQEALDREMLGEPAAVRITLLPKLQPGKRIVIGGIDGEDDREYAVSAPVAEEDAGGKKKVYVRSLTDDKHAIVDVTDPKKPTIHVQGSPAEVLEVDDRSDKQTGIFLRLWRTSSRVGNAKAIEKRELKDRMDAAVAGALLLNDDPSADGEVQAQDINKAIAKYPAGEQGALRDELIGDLNRQLQHHKLLPDGPVKVKVESAEEVSRRERVEEEKRRINAFVGPLNTTGDAAALADANAMLAEAQADANPAVLAALIRKLKPQLTQHQIVQNAAGDHIVRSTEEIEEEARLKKLNDAGDAIVEDLNTGTGALAKQITDRDFTPALNAFPDARRPAVLTAVLARLNGDLNDHRIIPSTTGDVIDILTKQEAERREQVLVASGELITDLDNNPTATTSSKLDPLMDLMVDAAERDHVLGELNAVLQHHRLTVDPAGNVSITLKSAPTNPDAAHEAAIVTLAEELKTDLNKRSFTVASPKLRPLLDEIAQLSDARRSAARDELITVLNVALDNHVLAADGDAGITVALKPNPSKGEKRIQRSAEDLVKDLNSNPQALDSRLLFDMLDGLALLPAGDQEARRDALVANINRDLQHHELVADGATGIALRLKPTTPPVNPDVAREATIATLGGEFRDDLNANPTATTSAKLQPLLDEIALLSDARRTDARNDLVALLNASLDHHVLSADGAAGIAIALKSKPAPATNPDAQHEADLGALVDGLRQMLIADPHARIDQQLSDIDTALAAFTDPADRRRRLVEELNTDPQIGADIAYVVQGDQIVFGPKQAPAPANTPEAIIQTAVDELRDVLAQPTEDYTAALAKVNQALVAAGDPQKRAKKIAKELRRDARFTGITFGQNSNGLVITTK